MNDARSADRAAKRLAWCACLALTFTTVSRPARADDTGHASPAPSGTGAAAPAPSDSASPASPPTTEEGGEIVFHASPRATDMAALTASSMQQVHVGTAKARYAMNIFGDVNFQFGNGPQPNGSTPGSLQTHPSFALGTLSFLITGELQKHSVSTAEFALEYDDTTNQVGIDIERLHVGWLGEHFFLYAGRVHTAFGYWNNAYHHGKWLQPNEERPRWVAFEDTGGILPIHTVGLSGGTNVEVGASTELKITLSVSNGRGNVVDDIRNTFDYQDGKALGSQIEFVGVGLPELRMGVSGMYDRIQGLPGTDPTGGPTRPALPNTDIDEYIMGAHVAYPGYPLLFIAESYYILHHVPGHAYATYGGFATLGRSFGIVTPYIRGQWIGTSGGSDPFFVPDPNAPGAARFDQVDGMAGVRVDLTDWTAVRAEYTATKIASDDIRHECVVQWSWGF